MGTKSQHRVTMRSLVDGFDYGVWDKKTGADVQATITKHRPGGMGAEKTYGGMQEVTDVTLSRVLERIGRDDANVRRRLRAGVGKERVAIQDQLLDGDGNSWNSPEVANGVLMRVSGSDVDSTSDDPDLYEVGVSLNGTIS